MVKNVYKKCLKSGDVSPKVTKKEAEVLYYLTEEFLTPKKISIRLKKSIQRVCYIIRNLRKKGLLDAQNQATEKNRCTFKHFSNSIDETSILHNIRLHSEEFNIRILYKDERYKEERKKGNTIIIDGNTIRLYRDALEVYSGQSFFAKTPQEAHSQSLKYWNRFFIKLENQFKIIIIKDKVQNIRLVKSHYSETNNELAKKCEKEGEKIRIPATEDGKIWLTADNSFNLHELETQHPETAKPDMESKVIPYLNDWRDNAPPTNSQLASAIQEIIKLQTTSIELENKLALNIERHLVVLNKMEKAIDWINKERGILMKKEKDMEKKYLNRNAQTKLDDY